MLYTPFLPEAAAGTLEPRHVVTPLREILKRTYLRLGAVTAHDPAARTVELRSHDGETEELRYDQLVLARRIRLADGAGPRPRPSTRSASRASPTRSGSATTWSRRWRRPTPPRTPPAARSCSPTSSSAAATRASRRSPSSRTSPPTRWTRYPRARLHGMRWILVEATDRVLPEIDLKLADYAVRELRGRGIEIRLGTTARGGRRPTRAGSRPARRVPTRTVVWTAGVTPAPEPRQPLRAARRARPGPGRRPPAASRAWTASGRSATAPRSPTPAGASRRRPPSTRSARRGSPPRNVAAALERRAAAALHATRAATAFVNLGRYKAVGRIGRCTFSRLPRLVDGPHATT